MNFSHLNLKLWILNCLQANKIITPTEIQSKTFEKDNKDKNLIITSPTGTGKSLCYLIPILNVVDLNNNSVQSIIILPTKELCWQVYNNLLQFKKFNNHLKIEVLSQGINCKKSQPQIIIGTPQKILSFLNSAKFEKKFIKYLIFDEADILIDFGFYSIIVNILNKIRHKQLLIYVTSATLHNSLAHQLKNFITNAKIISCSSSIWLNDNLSHNIIYQTQTNAQPLDTLLKFVNIINPFFCIIFVNTKKEGELIYQNFIKLNMNAALIHKDIYERKRKQIYRGIIANKYQYLISTDLIARGIDLPFADIVISYGLPQDPMWYIHRAGRVGRNNKKANAFLIYKNSDDYLINRLIKRGIKWKFNIIKNNQLIEQPKKLKLLKKNLLDEDVNQEIKMIFNKGSKHIKPCYKKKIKNKIKKIKQKLRHKNIEAIIKKRLLIEQINKNKNRK